MSAKKQTVKKSARTKKMLHELAHTTDVHESRQIGSSERDEEAIKKQFQLIQKEYSRLMAEVSKEFSLVRNWVEKEAKQKSNEILNKIPMNIANKIPVKILK